MKFIIYFEKSTKITEKKLFLLNYEKQYFYEKKNLSVIEICFSRIGKIFSISMKRIAVLGKVFFPCSNIKIFIFNWI